MNGQAPCLQSFLSGFRLGRVGRYAQEVQPICFVAYTEFLSGRGILITDFYFNARPMWAKVLALGRSGASSSTV